MSAAVKQATIEASPTVPTVTIVREFDASPDKVFQAHIDPELAARWLGPRNLTMKVDRWEGVTGGGYHYRAIRDGEEIAAFYGSFHEVRPSERLVQTFTFEGFPDGVSMDTHTFDELPGGRTRLTVVSVVDSFEARDAMLASGMEVGVHEGYEKLDEILAEG